MGPKRGEMETQGAPKTTFFEKVPKVSWTYYLLYVINISTPKNIIFNCLRRPKRGRAPRGEGDRQARDAEGGIGGRAVARARRAARMQPRVGRWAGLRAAR